MAEGQRGQNEEGEKRPVMVPGAIFLSKKDPRKKKKKKRLKPKWLEFSEHVPSLLWEWQFPEQAAMSASAQQT